jgi:EmrB/QacA subfamily drug resistance transporter
MTPKRWTLMAAVLGSGVVFLDSTIVNVALPRIGKELPRTFVGVLEGQSYVYNGYLLTLAALLILAGAITDMYGRKRMFSIGLVGFALMSAICGLAPNMELLIVARILQGTAGALLVPGSLALINATFTGEEQGRAFGVWAGASAATTILGPLVGGLLVDTFTWRLAFLMNLPLAALALYAMRHVAESRDEEAGHSLDWLGAAGVALGVGGLAFGAIYGSQRDWQGPAAFVMLGVGLVATLSLPLLMTRRPNPLVPPELFKSRNFTVVNIVTLVVYGALYVTFSYQAIFVQGTLGYTATAAGLTGIPGTLLLVFVSPRIGALSARFGPRWFMTIGPFLMALGVLWFARIPAGSGAWRLDPHSPSTFTPPVGYLVDLLPGGVLFGIGIATLVAPLTTALMTSVPVRHSGLASAINNAISRIGPQLLGAVVFIAITSSFYAGMASRMPGLDVSSQQVRQHLSPLNPPAPGAPPAEVVAARQASTDAYHLAMLIGASMLLLGALLSAVGLRSQPPAAPAEEVARSDPAEAAA